MRHALILLFLTVAACDSPTPGVARWDGRATREVGGMTFGLHWNTEQAEAYRVSRHLRPRLAIVMGNAMQAIEEASGCKVRPGSLTGDQALVMAQLDC